MRTASAERRTPVRARIPLDLDPADIEALDRFATANDFPSRNAAVRALIRRADRASRLDIPRETNATGQTRN